MGPKAERPAERVDPESLLPAHGARRATAVQPILLESRNTRSVLRLGVSSQHVIAWHSNEDLRLFLAELPDSFERCFKS